MHQPLYLSFSLGLFVGRLNPADWQADHSTETVLADRTNGQAYATLLRPSVCCL